MGHNIFYGICSRLESADVFSAGQLCRCRKPRPGLLVQLQKHYGIDMGGVPFIGDSERDLRAAVAIGARPILVLTGNGRKTLETLSKTGEPMEVFESLAAAVDALLQEPGKESFA